MDNGTERDGQIKIIVITIPNFPNHSKIRQVWYFE